MPREHAGTEDSCCRGLAGHQNSASGDFCGLQTPGCHRLQRIYNQILKVTIGLMIVLARPIIVAGVK